MNKSYHILSSVIIDRLFPDDTRLNNDPENTRQDTGLYELYKNVVQPYTEAVIIEAERYAGKKYAFLDEVPTSNWYGRNNEGPKDDPLMPGYASRGMSYSYGGKMSVEQFNNTVAPSAACQAPVAPRIQTYHQDPNNPSRAIYYQTLARAAVKNNAHTIDTDYKGDLQIINDNTGLPLCITGSGRNYYKYAGLKRHEKKSSEPHNIIGYYDESTDQLVPVLDIPYMTTNALTYYRPEYWAGIDCSGLVQRSITRANKLEIPGVISEVKDLGDIGTCSVDDQDCKPCGDPAIWSQSYMPRYARSIGDVAGQVNTSVTKRARKGDVVIYAHHIALMYSDRPTCTTDKKGQTTCTYEIIHASGSTCLDMDGNGECDDGEPFNRKVVVNSTQFFRTTPTGFGRIKLWD